MNLSWITTACTARQRQWDQSCSKKVSIPSASIISKVQGVWTSKWPIQAQESTNNLFLHRSCLTKIILNRPREVAVPGEPQDNDSHQSDPEAEERRSIPVPHKVHRKQIKGSDRHHPQQNVQHCQLHIFCLCCLIFCGNLSYFLDRPPETERTHRPVKGNKHI